MAGIDRPAWDPLQLRDAYDEPLPSVSQRRDTPTLALFLPIRYYAEPRMPPWYGQKTL